MMNEWKVANYELSLRLRELGVRQDMSERVWDYLVSYPTIGELRRREDSPCTVYPPVAAYDGSELGVMLPEYRNLGTPHARFIGEADQRAAWLILLLEAGGVTADEVNGRLEK